MKTCPKCAEQVQSAAKVCKHCGHQFGFKMPKLGCGSALIILIAVAFCSTPSPEQKARQDQLTNEYLEMDRIERLVKARLRDPASATFRHLDGGCGYVNSRNGFGGMTGEVEFVVGKNDKAGFREDNPKAFDIVWREHCIKGITP